MDSYSNIEELMWVNFVQKYVKMCKLCTFYILHLLVQVLLRYAHFECDSQLVADAVLGVSNPQVTISNIIAGIYQKLQVFKTMQLSNVK